MGRAWRSTLVEQMLARALGAESSGPTDWPRRSAWPRTATAVGRPGPGHPRMRLQRLTGLEQDKIVAEYKEVMEQIIDLLDILARPERITSIIGDELTAIRDQFGDARRSEIVVHTPRSIIEDLIVREDMVVTLSHSGYFKRQPLADYRAQRRGGRGKQAAAMKEDDFVDRLFVANTHDYILCFSNRGRVYWLKVYEVPEGSRNSRGKPIVNLFPLEEGEKITAVLPVKEFDENTSSSWRRPWAR
jgi:DNA gyrase subunit A